MMSAGVMVAVIPMIIVYSFLQDKIISGMVAGAVKGYKYWLISNIK